MTTYKGFYGTKEEYIAHLTERIQFWAKAFVEETNHRIAMSKALKDAENALAAEGIDWEQIEEIETNAMIV